MGFNNKCIPLFDEIERCVLCELCVVCAVCVRRWYRYNVYNSSISREKILFVVHVHLVQISV